MTLKYVFLLMPTGGKWTDWNLGAHTHTDTQIRFLHVVLYTQNNNSKTNTHRILE